MPLLSLWDSNPHAISEFTIEQVVTAAGDGNLKDGSECSRELREFLAQIPSEKLAKYIDHCLTNRFDKGGVVLQDLVNELGRRLDYEVTNGRYQGVQGLIGHDGLWRSQDGQTLIVEVKTTDAYRVSLDTIAGYRDRLRANGTIAENSSILIVVGRQDTGELEAQIRGSRHAWDIRLISMEALIKIVAVKENSDEPETGSKIRSVLVPVEYTRLDKLADLMFAAATDVETDLSADVAPTLVEHVEKAELELPLSTHELTDASILHAKRSEIVEAMSLTLGSALIKKSRALYQSADHQKRIACTLSKRYDSRTPYWYAYHPKWDDFLKDVDDGYFVLGCIDLSKAFAIPRSEMAGIVDFLHRSESERGHYWHVHIAELDDGSFELVIPKRKYLPMAPFEIALPA